jgi:hypothetical protein
MPTEYVMTRDSGYRALQLGGRGIPADIVDFLVDEGKDLVVEVLDEVTAEEQQTLSPDDYPGATNPAEHYPADVQVVVPVGSVWPSVIGVALIGGIGWMLLS